MIKLIKKIRQWIDYKRRGIKVYGFWTATNVYPTARIGDRVQIGWGCEIGHNVQIDRGAKIGAKCFIPEGVSIGHYAFIGPCSYFTNDRFPPSNKEKWELTVIEPYASIGAGVGIRCGVNIGSRAIIGAGSLVTKNISSCEIWSGNPARFMRQRTD